MAQAVRSLPGSIQEIIEIREWDIRTHEGVSRFKEIKCRSLPSIAINGELVFQALIPAQEELISEILARHQR